ncbi:hypothetical protein phiOC_p062 [Ochrobactrum phage vB_OspM_OC]|nr:hypothetical protein phiOC_p062 [Ochrobactrum phage vB_OspM_OC]
MTEITNTTKIDYGLQISKNLLIDHLTTGAYHYMLGEWIPKYPAKLIPTNSEGILKLTGMEGWQIARNLQISAENVIENLMREIGSDLVIRSGLNLASNIQNNPLEALHQIGRSFDIQINGYQDNMFNVAKEVQQIAKKASGIQLVYGQTSWIHLDIDPKRALSSATNFEAPEFKTVDSILGVAENGLTSLRGFL